MKHFLRAIRVLSGFWNGGVLGVYTLLEQDRSEMHFRFCCYRTPRIEDNHRDAIRKKMNTEPDWDLHRTFLAVVQEGSLSSAARRLGLTQPTVARHVDALEKAVGADLFLRSQRGLVPTEMALALYAETLPTWCSMTALLMDRPELLGSALCHHSGRDPPRMSAPVQAHYGIYRTP